MKIFWLALAIAGGAAVALYLLYMLYAWLMFGKKNRLF